MALAETHTLTSGCPSWCRGHSDRLHYGDDDCFDGGDHGGEDDHGLVLTMVEPYIGPNILTGESVWIPKRLCLSLFIQAGALQPTISFDGPTRPFQLTLTEAQRLADALNELTSQACDDMRARDLRPVPAIEAGAESRVPA